MNSTMSERGWRVHGRVQGVGFRWWAVKTGVGLGIVGRVWNEPDGTVVLHLRGPDSKLNEFSDRLRVGPMMAKVSQVDDLDPEGPWPASGVEIIG